MSILTLDPDLIAALRTDLDRADYTPDAVEALLGPVAAAALHREMLVPAHRVLIGRREPLATLIRLLMMGDSVDHADVTAALPTLGVAGALRLGLVAPEGDALKATCEIAPHAADDRHWWVASDLSEMVTRGPLREDHVLGIGGASATLIAWTPRPRVPRAADIGTGCGVQALHLEGHTDEVVVTDLSARALGYARFNAALNSVAWDVRAGSLLEPLAGQRFDLIVSNPPFVITPRGTGLPTYEYRDGGAEGDAIVGHLVRHLGEHLEPGGIAQLLGNWEITSTQDWQARVRGWLAGTGLDAWVVQREVTDPAQYAETWARDGGHRAGTADFEQQYRAWLDDFAARGVEAIGFGVITLQRPAEPRDPFVDLMEATGPVA
ncbi:DUF7059 domain-containing protein, partial [Kribbia dieselivorans]|uniref:DUF7059 domain-containing protein n=1 Tax=Kribbia dieselivorans TaxID=331526 RepID=UPI000838F3EE